MRSDVVKDVLVERLRAEVARREAGRVPGTAADAIERVAPALVPGRRIGIRTIVTELARAGYLSRLVETELFEAARAPVAEVAERLRARLGRAMTWSAAAAEVGVALAATEPAARPAPGSVPSWRVPGPGGHVRHYLALRTMDDLVPDPPLDVDPVDLKRAFLAGFFVRCCEEAQAPGEPRDATPDGDG